MPSVVTANKIVCSVSGVDITACAGETFGTKVETINALRATGRRLPKGWPTFPTDGVVQSRLKRHPLP